MKTALNPKHNQEFGSGGSRLFPGCKGDCEHSLSGINTGRMKCCWISREDQGLTKLLHEGLSAACSCRTGGALAASLASEERQLVLRPCLVCRAPVGGSGCGWVRNSCPLDRGQHGEGRVWAAARLPSWAGAACQQRKCFGLSPPTLTDGWYFQMEVCHQGAARFSGSSEHLHVHCIVQLHWSREEQRRCCLFFCAPPPFKNTGWGRFYSLFKNVLMLYKANVI